MGLKKLVTFLYSIKEGRSCTYFVAFELEVERSLLFTKATRTPRKRLPLRYHIEYCSPFLTGWVVQERRAALRT